MPEEKSFIDELEPGARFDALRLHWERRFPSGRLICGLDVQQESPAYTLDLKPCEGLPALDSGGLAQPDLIQAERGKFVANLQQKAAAGWRVEIFLNTEGTKERFAELAEEQVAGSKSQVASSENSGFRSQV